MLEKMSSPAHQQTLRKRILTFVGALILLSLFGSTISLYRITGVNHSLEAINRVSVPLGRLMAQMQADSEVLRRELDRSLGYSHWKDPHWHPRSLPRWITDVLDGEVERARELVRTNLAWTSPESKLYWENWLNNVSGGVASLKDDSDRLYIALKQNDDAVASEIQPRLTARLDEWAHQLQWGVGEYERFVRMNFSQASARVSELRTGLEIILIVIVSFSLLLLWIGERALRPLEDLTKLARQITRRGLRKEDKVLLAQVPFTRADEVSQLAREFHSMATSLLEREKTVETQNTRLQEQNKILREMNALRERLHEAEHLAAIGRMSAQVAHEVRNPLHSIGLEAEVAAEMAARLGDVQLKQALQSILSSVDRLEKITENYLKLSRLSAGQKDTFDLGDALEAVLAIYGPVCESQGITVDWSRGDRASLLVFADRDLLEQVLGNLMRNSIQALEAAADAPLRQGEPKIVWTLGQAESGRVWARIEDNGPGVSPDVREKIFTPFVTTRAQGTGLGLSFVKKVMEDHGGVVTFLDRAPGWGACFEIILPAVPPPAPEKSVLNEEAVYGV